MVSGPKLGRERTARQKTIGELLLPGDGDTKSGAMDAATFLKGPTAAQRGGSNVGHPQLERTFLT